MPDTSTAGVPPLSTRRKFRGRTLAYLLFALLVAVLCAAVWLYSLARIALPQLDGKVTITAVSATVQVIRDAHGAPTIEAASLDDLFLAQGYVTAQDRLWQMDIMRRFAAGDLAEILGPDLVEHDREQRILGMRLAARKAVEVAAPQVRSHYEAYARGVNAYIESQRGRLPLEFRILGYKPKPWTPEDSTLIAAQMVKDLTTSPRQDLVREKILAKLGPELTADLFVNTSLHDRPPTVLPSEPEEQRDQDNDDNDGDSGPANLVTQNFEPPELSSGGLLKAHFAGNSPTAAAKADIENKAVIAALKRGATQNQAQPKVFQQPSEFFVGPESIDPAVNGSNNWVVSGMHTVTGKPLLVDGNIGYQATGKIPIRASGDGSLPENGSDNAHEWTGYIPFEKLPSILNPTSGVLATANSRITPDGYAYSLSTEWEAPWRSARIYRVLESGGKFSAADMLALQTDIYSDADRLFAERLVAGVDQAKAPSARAKQAAEIMRQWDGGMRAESSAPTIETRARAELMRLLLEPKLGPAPKDAPSDGTLNWKSYHWGMQSVWLENVLVDQPKRWLPAAYANYDELLAAAVEAIVSAPDAPADLNSWRWGNYNPVEVQHPVLGRIPFLRHWTGPGVQPQSGSGFTVKAVTRKHGPSERMTVDLSNLDQSTLNLVTGQAGNFLSPFYMDQWKAWYEGTTLTLPFSQPAVEKAKTHLLTLEPK